MERDIAVEPVADDLSSVILDLLISEAGYQRHGVNLLLLFGDPETAGISDDGGGG
ncbi:formate dehydrogenase accessory protein FdhE [compost metagenome]